MSSHLRLFLGGREAPNITPKPHISCKVRELAMDQFSTEVRVFYPQCGTNISAKNWSFSGFGANVLGNGKLTNVRICWTFHQSFSWRIQRMWFWVSPSAQSDMGPKDGQIFQRFCWIFPRIRWISSELAALMTFVGHVWSAWSSIRNTSDLWLILRHPLVKNLHCDDGSWLCVWRNNLMGWSSTGQRHNPHDQATIIFQHGNRTSHRNAHDCILTNGHIQLRSCRIKDFGYAVRGSRGWNSGYWPRPIQITANCLHCKSIHFEPTIV